MAESKIIIGYWNIKGRGEILRHLSEFLKIPYENKLYTDPTQWFGKEKPALKSDFPNLPYILDGDQVITETDACAMHLIHKSNRLDLLGSNNDEMVHITQLRGVLTDLQNNLAKVAFNKDGDVAKGIEETCIPKLVLLSKHLGDGEWLIGKISYADFLFVRTLGLLNMNGEWLEKFPNLVSYLERFRDLPAIKTYLASDRNLKVPMMPPSMVNPNFKVL